MAHFQGIIGPIRNPAQAVASNPFNVWLLCGVNGIYTDISPLSMLVGGGWGNVSFHWNGSIGFETSVSQLAYGLNVSFKATPVCMWPPFVFIVLVRELRQSIVHINYTCVDVTLAGGLADWNTTAASQLKEWAVIAGLACA